MKIAIIGCGVMGSAFARYFAKDHSVVLCDHNGKKMELFAKEINATVQGEISEAIKGVDLILLAVKPKDLSHVAKMSMGLSLDGKILVSILAGISVSVLRQCFPKALCVRTMPNLALTCGQGVIGLVEDDQLVDSVKSQLSKLFQGIGLVAWLPEKKIEALTALTGSGIAFVFAMIEAMMDGGVFMGFTAKESREFTLKAFVGAVALLRQTDEHPAELRSKVCSPAGTTISGLRVMDQRGVGAGIMDALVASYEKGISMGEELGK